MANEQQRTETPDHDLLVRIETKLDIYITRQGDHEARIRRLEQLGIISGLLILLAQVALASGFRLHQ